jgi:hypothetical protein
MAAFKRRTMRRVTTAVVLRTEQASEMNPPGRPLITEKLRPPPKSPTTVDRCSRQTGGTLTRIFHKWRALCS